MAEAMNLELRQLAASGCKVIQVEEPTLHFMARYYPEQKEFIDFLVDAFNREIEGLDDVEVWIHTCWGNPNMQKVFSDESYANSMEIYLERLKGDVWTIEATENNFRELSLFDSYKNSLKKKIAVGVISHRTLQADFPDVIAERIRRCLQHIPADKLILSTDCGFGRQGFNRHLAFYKTVGIPMARNIILNELGVEQRYIPGGRRAARLGPAPGPRAAHASPAAAVSVWTGDRWRSRRDPLPQTPAYLHFGTAWNGGSSNCMDVAPRSKPWHTGGSEVQEPTNAACVARTPRSCRLFVRIDDLGVGHSLAFQFLDFTDPDIAEADRVAVELQADGALVGMCRVFGGAMERACPPAVRNGSG